MKLSLLLTAIVYVLLFASTNAVNSQNMESLVFFGTAVDERSAAVEKQTVLFVNGKGDRFETITNTDGDYEIRLPKDTYSILVKRSGFCPESRTALTVSNQLRIMVSFQLISCSLESGFNIDLQNQTHEPVSRYRSPFKIEEIGVSALKSSVWIRHGLKVNFSSSRKFEGYKTDQGTLMPVELIFGHLRITASELIVTRELCFKAKGNVILENGTTSTTLDCLDFVIDGTSFVVSGREKKKGTVSDLRNCDSANIH